MSPLESESSQPEAPGLQIEQGAKPARRFSAVSMLVLFAIVTGGVAWLRAQGPQPAFGQLVASPTNFVPTTSTAIPNFVANTPTTVTFTIRIDTPTLNPTTVELQQAGSSGNLLARVGKMNDKGKDGDARAGDKTFTLRVSLNEPSVGRIYFRAGAAFRGNTQNAWSTPIPVDVDPFPLPPDPGDAGKQTLAGIDSDHDGVRDDVQRWIGLNFSSARTRAALEQTTIGSQDTIVSTDAPGAQKAAEEELAGSNCLGGLLGAGQGYDISLRLDDQILNTASRRNAYQASARRVNINLFSPPPRLLERRNSCSFNPDSLPN